jgi:DNA-directed RNA polymerase specialized sigma24 family protein
MERSRGRGFPGRNFRLWQPLRDEVLMTDDFPGVDWGDAYLRAATYAIRRGQFFGLRIDPGQAREIAGDALRQIVEAGWDRAKYPEFADYLASRVNGIMVNRSRRKGTRAEVATEGTPEPIPESSPPRSPEEAFADRELASLACTRVLERLDGNEAAAKVFLAMADGLDKPAEIAAETGLAIGVVYRARERISLVKAEVAAQLRKELEA